LSGCDVANQANGDVDDRSDGLIQQHAQNPRS